MTVSMPYSFSNYLTKQNYINTNQCLLDENLKSTMVKLFGSYY